MIDQEQLENWFTHHPPTGNDVYRYKKLRAAGYEFAKTIIESTPPSADQSAAIRKVREAVMTANAAIACRNRDARYPDLGAPPVGGSG